MNFGFEPSHFVAGSNPSHFVGMRLKSLIMVYNGIHFSSIYLSLLRFYFNLLIY